MSDQCICGHMRKKHAKDGCHGLLGHFRCVCRKYRDRDEALKEEATREPIFTMEYEDCARCKGRRLTASSRMGTLFQVCLGCVRRDTRRELLEEGLELLGNIPYLTEEGPLPAKGAIDTMRAWVQGRMKEAGHA